MMLYAKPRISRRDETSCVALSSTRPFPGSILESQEGMKPQGIAHVAPNPHHKPLESQEGMKLTCLASVKEFEQYYRISRRVEIPSQVGPNPTPAHLGVESQLELSTE